LIPKRLSGYLFGQVFLPPQFPLKDQKDQTDKIDQKDAYMPDSETLFQALWHETLTFSAMSVRASNSAKAALAIDTLAYVPERLLSCPTP